MVGPLCYWCFGWPTVLSGVLVGPLCLVVFWLAPYVSGVLVGPLCLPCGSGRLFLRALLSLLKLR